MATPHLANQGILSASIGANVLGTPHIANQGLLSASYGAAAVGTPHLFSGIDMRRLESGGYLPAFIMSAGNVPVLFSVTGGSQPLIQWITSGGFEGGMFRGGSQLQIYHNLGSGDVRVRSGEPTLLIVMAAGGDDSLRIQRGPPGAAGEAPSLVSIMQIRSGDITSLNYVDGVDISAHRHAGGTGEAPTVQSAGLGSGQVGPMHIFPNTQPWGTLMFYNPASGWQVLAPGTSGQRLTTNASGANPAWAA